jgi:hypothetical protein
MYGRQNKKEKRKKKKAIMKMTMKAIMKMKKKNELGRKNIKWLLPLFQSFFSRVFGGSLFCVPISAFIVKSRKLGP